jgi:CRISPR/Cas system CSM-associated protein Csm3 (group 7 of RAMP superfamily)
MTLPNYERFVAVARVAIEAVTPLSVTRGETDRGFDTALVVDANGLPTIPGTALAGVLRHLYVEQFEPARASPSEGETPLADALFGYAASSAQQASRVEVSWAAIHDAYGRPVDGLLTGADLDRRLPVRGDKQGSGEELGRATYAAALRSLALEPVIRDHVRIDEFGAAKLDGPHGMKFDRAVLPAGHRFTFEILLRSQVRDDPDWARLLDLLTHPAFRLGGATRRGLGRVAVVSIDDQVFDLADQEQRRQFLSLPRSLAERGTLQRRASATGPAAWRGWEKLEIHWRPTQEWRVGGAAGSKNGSQRDADMRPLQEPVVRWTSDTTPMLESRWVLPASGLKGALAHRVVYHANRLEARWTDSEDPDTAPYTVDECPALDRLFGFVRASKQKGSADQARAGSVLLDDRLVPDGAMHDNGSVGRLQHTSGDRFTGGVLDGALFDEEFLRPGVEGHPAWRFDCWVRTATGSDDDRAADALARRVFVCALQDWLAGRLNVGAAGSRGFGYGTGEMTLPAGWSTAGGSS